MKTALLSATLVMMMSWFDNGVDDTSFPELTLQLSVNTGQQFVVKPELKLVRGQSAQVTVYDRAGVAHNLVIRSALEDGRTVVNLTEDCGNVLMAIRKGSNAIDYAGDSGLPMHIAVEYQS